MGVTKDEHGKDERALAWWIWMWAKRERGGCVRACVVVV
ncbi:hypothetical protein CGRA01v4_08004 [Colletotrichum graminicola]|nr:hypothetical protein CGRA01v4_08004 [Colletotrichum graminicola]